MTGEGSTSRLSSGINASSCESLPVKPRSMNTWCVQVLDLFLEWITTYFCLPVNVYYLVPCPSCRSCPLIHLYYSSFCSSFCLNNGRKIGKVSRRQDRIRRRSLYSVVNSITDLERLALGFSRRFQRRAKIPSKGWLPCCTSRHSMYSFLTNVLDYSWILPS